MYTPTGGFGINNTPTAGYTYQAMSILNLIIEPVLDAARMGDSAVISEWLQQGGNADIKNFTGWTPLMAAAVRGQSNIVELLLSDDIPGGKKADPNIPLEAVDALPIFWAGQSGDLETVKSILKKHPQHLFEICSVNGHTVLLQAAFFGSEKHLKLANWILDNAAEILGIPPDDTQAAADALKELTLACNVRGYTGLTMSELWGNEPMRKLFKQYDTGAEAEKSAYFENLLESIRVPVPQQEPVRTEQILSNQLIEIIEKGIASLKRLNADNSDEIDHLKTKIMQNVQEIVENPNFNINRLGGALSETPLIFAITGIDNKPFAAEFRHQLVKYLLEHGADPDIPEKHPMAIDAVIRASVLNHFEILKLISQYMRPLAFAASMNDIPQINGQTALQDSVHRALTASDETVQTHLKQISWMVKHGARYDIKDYTGVSPEMLVNRAFDDSIYKERAKAVSGALLKNNSEKREKIMTNEEALSILEPFYNLFRAQKRDWNKALESLDDSWKAYYSNNEYRDKNDTQQCLQGFFDLIPDINVEIKQISVDNDVIAVRSELTGTPKGDFLVPYTGRSFKIMTVDFNRVKDGKLVELYHSEDWETARQQLSGEDPAS